jgi:hypothetical protein
MRVVTRISRRLRVTWVEFAQLLESEPG